MQWLCVQSARGEPKTHFFLRSVFLCDARMSWSLFAPPSAQQCHVVACQSWSRRAYGNGWLRIIRAYFPPAVPRVTGSRNGKFQVTVIVVLCRCDGSDVTGLLSGVTHVTALPCYWASMASACRTRPSQHPSPLGKPLFSLSYSLHSPRCHHKSQFHLAGSWYYTLAGTSSTHAVFKTAATQTLCVSPSHLLIGVSWRLHWRSTRVSSVGMDRLNDDYRSYSWHQVRPHRCWSQR